MAKWAFFKGNKENWFSSDIYNWMDPSESIPYPSLEKNCIPSVIREALRDYPDLFLQEIRYVAEGSWKEKNKPLLYNIPAFYFIRIKQFISGTHIADLRVFLPERWNGRFMGIAGAGTNMETDWDMEQTSALTTWPMAVRNGFACVVCNGATGSFVDQTWGFKEGGLDWDMIRNWAFTGTHIMTASAKAVVRACYGSDISKSYMHGTSGGGRQVILEAERYPGDYDGLWADGPLYDFYNLMFSCLWAALVYNNEPHRVPLEKYQAAHKLARSSEKLCSHPYDPEDEEWKTFLAGLPCTPTPVGGITVEDVRVMKKIWDGPVLSDGSRITYGFGPEIVQWPVAHRKFGYLKIHEDGTITNIPFAVQFLRWLVRDPDWDFASCTYETFEKIYLEHKDEFKEFAFYGGDLRGLAKRGGKLMITHGTGDHIAPNQLTVDYYRKASSYFPGKCDLDRCFRVFRAPHGGHALFDWDGPNVCNADGMRALMAWAEEDRIPCRIRTINYDFLEDKVVREDYVEAFNG